MGWVPGHLTTGKGMAKKTIILDLGDAITKGRGWVEDQMTEAGMKLFPFEWLCGEEPGQLVIEGETA